MFAVVTSAAQGLSFVARLRLRGGSVVPTPHWAHCHQQNHKQPKSYLPRHCTTEYSEMNCVRRLLVTASVVPSSPTLATLMKELRSSETSVLTRATRRNSPEDDILHNHRRENLKFYIALTGWTL
jgi:hypothetical protein